MEMTEQELLDLTSAVTTFGMTVTKLKKRRMLLTWALGVVTLVLVGVVAWIMLVSGPRFDRANGRVDVLARQAQRTALVAQNASSNAAKLAESDHTRCLAGNEFRKADRARWDFLISASTPPDTAEGRATVKKFEAFIDKADTLRKCG